MFAKPISMLEKTYISKCNVNKTIKNKEDNFMFEVNYFPKVITPRLKER